MNFTVSSGLTFATGPLYIEGAEPGDTLAVSIDDITVANQGVMAAIPGSGALGHFIKSMETKIVPIKDDYAIFNKDIKIPISPMIGVIGTAPLEEDISCGTPGRHGGNMDTRLIGKGSILYLPVFAEGALLSMGDLHAVMGDGEVSVCGVEIPGEVTVTIKLIKAQKEEWPVLETPTHWYTIASGKDINEASELALDAMLSFLIRLPLSINDKVSLLSIAGSLEICQVVDPLKTVRMGISKESLVSYKVEF